MLILFAGFNPGYSEPFEVSSAAATATPCSKRKKRTTTMKVSVVFSV